MESEFKKLFEVAHKNNNVDELENILDEYFVELEKYHPQTYTNLMKELHKVGAKINILSEEELAKLVKHIHHKGMPELWTLDQTSSVAKDIGINFDKWKYNKYTFNYVMNMMRADYYSELKELFTSSPLMKQAVLDSPKFYAHLAKAWLNDEDAPADKALQYIHIVTGEKVAEV